MAERRLHPRVRGPFDGYWDGAGRHAGRVVDLSLTGCFVESVLVPVVGQRVTVSVGIAGQQIDLPATVVYVEVNLGFAVHFVDMPAEIASLLRKEIALKLPT